MSDIGEYRDFEKFQEKYLAPFEGLHHIFWPEKGYIVWRSGTGNNTELLHIGTFSHGKGYAKELIREMLNELKSKPPFYSVFGFALSSREELRPIYKALGFNISDNITGMYKGGPAFMFSASYEALQKKYGLS